MSKTKLTRFHNKEIVSLSRGNVWMLQSNSTYLLSNVKNNINKNYNNIINDILNQCFIKKNVKIKFEGKGYYLYKNLRNTLAPKFGYAHRVYLYCFSNWIKVLSKTKLLIYNNVKSCLLNDATNLKLLRPRNPFTGRGVRFGRSVRFKKRGKVSSFK